MVQLTSLFSAFALASYAVASPLLAARDVEQPIKFIGVTYDGEGCPAGSIDVGSINFETWEFQIFYRKLTASIHGGDPKVNVKCQIKVEFATTTSTQLVVLGGDYHGYIDIEKGIYAKQQNQYKWDKNEGVANMQWEFKGPLKAETTFTNQLDTVLVSSCAARGGTFKLIINNYLTLTSQDGASGTITVNSLDAAVMQSIKLKTIAC